MDLQDTAFCEFTAHLVRCAVQAVVETPADTADELVSVLAEIEATTSGRRHGLWRRVLCTSVVKGLRDAVDRQRRASQLLLQYSPAQQRQAAGALLREMRQAKIKVFGIKERLPGVDPGKVRHLSLEQVIKLNMAHGIGWQERLREALQAAGLPGHPLKDSMSGFMKDLQKQMAGAGVSGSDGLLDASAPIQGLVQMVAEHGPIWVIGRGFPASPHLCVCPST